MHPRSFLVVILSLFSGIVAAQTSPFTHQDTLRGSITPERAWWDLTYYHLNIKVNPADSTIQGKNTVQYKVLTPGQRMQIDLQEPMRINKVIQAGKELTYKRDGNAYFIQLAAQQRPGDVNEVEVYYGGRPP